MVNGKRLPKTCIIGAGCSGLTAAKALKDKGVPYDCFEASDRIGGTWAFKNPNGKSAAYRSLHIDTSKEKLQFQDFPIDPSYPDFPHHSQIFDYFNKYCDHFGLRDSITFNTEVSQCNRLDDGTWEVQLSTGEARYYDALVVANGHHWDPRWPEPRFNGHFDGTEMHAHSYIDPFEPIDMRGKNVVVVGIGNSAMDISCEISQRYICDNVYLSTRRGAHIVPKYVLGKPLDHLRDRFVNLALEQKRNLIRLIIRRVVGRMEDFGLPKPDHEYGEAHPTVSSEFLTRVGSGDIKVKPNIEELKGKVVKFVDGTEVKADVIIYATGYNITFPFFKKDFISAPGNVLPLFKRIVKPEINNLFFVGLAQPLPTLINFVEFQSKWIAECLSGEYALPDKGEMERVIREDEKKNIGHYVKTARHTMQLDLGMYKLDINEELERGRKRAAGRQFIPDIKIHAAKHSSKKAA